MNWDTIRNRCESTPFKEIKLGNRYRIELYHSSRAGAYGFQVYAVWVDYEASEVFNDEGELMYHETQAYFYKTDGCGYCKESAALEHVLHTIGRKPKGMSVGGETIPHEYRVGGNFYAVPESKLRVIK